MSRDIDGRTRGKNIEKLERSFARHRVSDKVMFVSRALKELGVLGIQPRKFAEKLQRLLVAPSEQKLTELMSTQRDDVRQLLFAALLEWPEHRDWVSRLIFEEKRLRGER